MKLDLAKYSRALRLLKFSDNQTVQQMFKNLTHVHLSGSNHPDWTANHETDRGAFADAYEEATGDNNGAAAARNYSTPIHYDGYRVRPGVIKYENLYGWHTDDNDPENGLVESSFNPDRNVDTWSRSNTLSNTSHNTYGSPEYRPTPDTIMYLNGQGGQQMQREHILPVENRNHNYISNSGVTSRKRK